MATITLTGQELFDFYTLKDGEYKQTLLTASMLVDDETLYSMLEKAEKEGKKIVLKESITDVDDPPMTVDIE